MKLAYLEARLVIKWSLFGVYRTVAQTGLPLFFKKKFTCWSWCSWFPHENVVTNYNDIDVDWVRGMNSLKGQLYILIFYSIGAPYDHVKSKLFIHPRSCAVR